MNNITSILTIFLLVLFISGCTSVPIPKITKYSLTTAVTENNKIKNINLAVQRVRGRTQFDKKNLSISPKKYVMDSYSTAQWAESPCSMLTDNIVAYLSKDFNYVTSSLLNHNNSLDYTISVYIDDLTHIKRDDKWFAVLTLHYEIASAKTRKIVKNNWFREKIELTDSSVQTYVNIQNKSVDKFLQQLTSEIADL
ncbi:membrane integrity-associated transporter subunit PqiC [bacterium]|nr:membrane integrity-associated transporter subunit PqiC [bacterium]